MRCKIILLAFIVCFSYACQKQQTEIIIPKTEYNISSNGADFEVYLQANDNLEVIIEDSQWIEMITTKSLKLGYFNFKCKPNLSDSKRTNKITFQQLNGIISKSITVIQDFDDQSNYKITSFVFEVKNNPALLQNDVIGKIIGDSLISIYIDHIVESGKLTPTIEFEGKSIDPINNVDFTQKVTYTLESYSGKTKKYDVLVNTNNKIPVLWISTINKAPIDSKDNYITGSVKLNGNGVVPSMEADMKIKGRGNSTWGLPKKPYKIKFDQKQSMAGFPADKEWILLANCYDRTLMRNQIAFQIGDILKMDWSNRGSFVEIYLNEQYQGVYQLCEQIKIAENRVNVVELTDADIQEPQISGGYLLELDSYFDEDLKFRSALKNLPVMIKEPDLNTTQFDWIQNHFNEVEACIYSLQFADQNNGYQKYIDTDSFIKWWIVYEVMGNFEPNHPKSSYMYKDRGGKLKMGPIWDFDYATCLNGGTEGFYIKDAIWYGRLFEDPQFVQQVKNVWNNNKSKLEQIQLFINQQANLLHYAEKHNFEKWGRYSWDPSETIMNSYANEIQMVKIYFEKRLKWLDVEINKL